MCLLSGSMKEIVRKLQSGQVSPMQLYEQCQQRLKLMRILNAYITETTRNSRLQAHQSRQRYDQGKPRGVLDGVPVAVKDNFCTKGVKTTCASKMLAEHVPAYDATVVQRLKEQGAVIMGKSNMDEFAMGGGSTDGCFGPVKNPWTLKSNQSKSIELISENDWLIAGGSSGGSAVAVASGSALAAIGSDTGGSTRNPAAMCGLVGLKPTYGMVSRNGLIPLVNSLDCPSILTRTADDAALMFGILCGNDPSDSTSTQENIQSFSLPDHPSIKNLSVGIPREFYVPELSADVLKHWHRVADLLENGGAHVKQVSLPHTKYSIMVYAVLGPCEISSNMARFDGLQFGHRNSDSQNSLEGLFAASRHEGFNNVVRGRILSGNYFLLKTNYDKFFLQAQKVRRLIADDYRIAFSMESVDVLLTPTVLAPAGTIGDYLKMDNHQHLIKEDVFTQAANMAGIPAVNIPVGLSQTDRPIGLQLLANHKQEKLLLSVAKWIEQQLQCKLLESLNSSLITSSFA